MINFQTVWNWYSRESVQYALIEASRFREVVSVFKDGSFGKRPDVIQYQGDVLQAVAEGTIAFHGSVERWRQPMQLDVGMTKADLDSLRQGWDVFIDPDVPDFDIAKIAVKQITEALKDHGVTSYSVKFSGGKSFHIGIPFESLPEKINFQPTNILYPDLLHKIIEYLKWYMKDQLKANLLSLDSLNNLSQRVGKPLNEISDANGLNPFKIISMDIFSSRHLFRLPYSLHEKTMLVSLPIKPFDVPKFDKEYAKPEKVKVEERFLLPRVTMHDAEAFIVEALDWASKHIAEVKEELPKPKVFKHMKAIPEMFFPPCIQHVLNGMKDGRKRSLFILINFLRNMSWDLNRIEKRIFEWNEKNYPPLRANYVRSQLRWHFRQDRNLLPPNCVNDNFYKAMGLFDLCNEMHALGVKNPVNWPYKKMMKSNKLKIVKEKKVN